MPPGPHSKPGQASSSAATAKDSPLDVPYNAEPHKCAKIAWYPMTMLPAATMPYSALGVFLYQRKASFGPTGW